MTKPIVFITRTVQYADVLPRWCAHSEHVDYEFVDTTADAERVAEIYGVTPEMIPCALLPRVGLISDVAALYAWVAAPPVKEPDVAALTSDIT